MLNGGKGMNADFQRWARRTMITVANDSARYRSLYQNGVRTWPIPFFGKLAEADVLTVGVNPSWTEFNYPRWHRNTTDSASRPVLWNYFDLTDHHRWFLKWEKALNEIHCSYREGKRFLAAHIDLSPRATVAMSKVSDPALFREMVKNDLC